jgi:hypothetical protein
MKHSLRTYGFKQKTGQSALFSQRTILMLILAASLGVVSVVTGSRAAGSAPLTDLHLQPGREMTGKEESFHSRTSWTFVSPTPAGTPEAKTSPKEAEPAATPAPCSSPAGDMAGQAVRLYYFREATKIVAVLNAVANQEGLGADLKCLNISNPSEDEIILYGSRENRDYARRVIATLDLPRPGISMEMWGIQVSSRKPDEMAKVMPRIRNEINRTQQAVRETYVELQRLTRESIPDDELDARFTRILQERLFYRSALDARRPLSFADILLRMIAARDPGRAAVKIANALDQWVRGREYGGAVDDSARSNEGQPFARFFRTRGLTYSNRQWVDNSVSQNALQGRVAVLEFGLHYGQLVHDPRNFSPYSLQQSAEVLNSRLQDASDALSLDMQDLFVEPTLVRIQAIVKQFKEVEYAQVGKTSVASLSGTSTEVTSHSVNAFDVTPPLRLSELLDKADKLSKSLGGFVPHPADNVVGAMPYTQLIGLIAAFGEERSVWRELQSGVSLTVTPNVLRNMTSAELEIKLQTGDPQAGTREQGVRPLTRVSQHDLKTKVYVNALDFFDLSAFASQSTLGGGRGYVPIIGPVWEGLFGAIPVAGNLFSWKKSPQTVYSESLVLTNSFVTPTVMGIAVLYPTELFEPTTGAPLKYDKAMFDWQWKIVADYKDHLGPE